MLYRVTTAKDLETTSTALQEAVARHHFGVLHVHDLTQTMARKGVEFGRACRVFEICNPHQAKRVLEQHIEIATALPCRIAVYEEDGGITLATLRPSLMLSMFGPQAELQRVAVEVEEAIVAIMDEAAA